MSSPETCPKCGSDAKWGRNYGEAPAPAGVFGASVKCDSEWHAPATPPAPAASAVTRAERALQDRIDNLRLTLAHMAHGGVLRDPEDGGVETAIRWANDALKADDAAPRGKE